MYKTRLACHLVKLYPTETSYCNMLSVELTRHMVLNGPKSEGREAGSLPEEISLVSHFTVLGLGKNITVHKSISFCFSESSMVDFGTESKTQQVTLYSEQ